MSGYRRLGLTLLLLLTLAGVSQAATRYVTTVACGGTSYSVTNNNCTGSDGPSHTSIASALTASGTGDTIRLRAVGSPYNTPTGGLAPKASQTWEGCRAANCGTNETVQINSNGQQHIINVPDASSGVTIRYLTLVGGTQAAIRADLADNLTLDTLDISGWGTSCTDILNGWPHAIQLASGGSGANQMTGIVVQNNTIHDGASCPGLEWAGIGIGGESGGGLIKNNTVLGPNISDGIWLDVRAGAPHLGYTRHTVDGNTVANTPRICFHIEDESSWILQRNIGYGCNEGIRVRPAYPQMQGHRVYNNTISAGQVGIWLSDDEQPSGPQTFTDSEFKNNIVLASGGRALLVSSPYQSDTTNFYLNNLFRNTGGTPDICWGGSGTDFNASNCNSPGTSYTNAQIANWNAVSAQVDLNISTAPVFVNAAGGDFRLCVAAGNPSGCASGQPAGIIDGGVNVGLSYNGSAPDLGALESTPASPAPVITAFTATSPVNPGSASTLAWTVTDATSCTPSMMSGTDATWTGSTPNPVSGSMSSGVFTAVKRVYRLSCTGAGGGPVTADATVFGGYRLAKHPSNGHWLRWLDGSAKMLLGYGLNTWKPTAAEMDTYQGKMNYWRLFAFSFNEDFWPDDDQRMGMPVVRSGGAGTDWDYATWNQNFWDNLHTFLTNAYDRGIAAGICLWDGHWALPGGSNGANSTWATADNIQAISWSWTNSTTDLVNATPCPTSGTAELGCYQQKFMERLRDEIAPYPHIIIELNNEDSAGNQAAAYSAWYLHWATLFNNGGFIIAVTEEASSDGDAVTDATFNSTASLSMKSYHTRSGNPFTSTRLGYNKMIVNDADDAATDEPAPTARLYAWRALVRGGHWNDYTEAGTFPIADKLNQYGNLLSFLSTYHPPLTAMVPNQQVQAGACMTAGASSPLCLWQSGTAWLLYVTADVSVNLAAAPSGTLNYRWYNPVNKAEVSPGSVTCPCTTQAFTKPSDNTDMVLYIGNLDVTAPAAPTNLRVVNP